MESSLVRETRIRGQGANLLRGFSVLGLTSLATVMIVTNPSEAAYEAYATERMVVLLDQNVCAEAPKAFDLKKECQSMLKTHRSKIHQFIADGTRRQNFLFFSVYTTDLEVASFLPTYRVETVGAFRRFHVYDTQKQ